jgi:16S rRNA (guanine527-N7)-methyltransferase
MHDLLNNILSELSLKTPPDFSAQIFAYLDLLDRWNRAYNLTAIWDPRARMIRHIADSLAVASYINEGQFWLDVGSGAGLPGIPLALLRPDQQWTLLDSNAKKTHFLVQAKAVLGLNNVTVVHSPVESFKPTEPTYFDGIICRAWTQLSQMLDKTQHLCQKPAALWAMKGAYPTEELAHMAVPYTVYPLQVPYLDEQRHLVRIGKLHE